MNSTLTRVALGILSHLPLFNCISKKNFGSGNKWSDLDLFSLIHFDFGAMKVFIASIQKGEGFRFVRELKYSDVAK